MGSLRMGYFPLWAMVGASLLVVGPSPQKALAGPLLPALSGSAFPSQAAELPAGVVRIGVKDFERLLHEGNVVLVDVRSYRAYLTAHLPDAVSIPLDKLEGALDRLRASNARIVFYCGGEAGMKSGRAAGLLKQHGFEHVYCLDGGFDRWVASGRVVFVQPTET
jgi:thiosulfate sulfurtransferase